MVPCGWEGNSGSPFTLAMPLGDWVTDALTGKEVITLPMLL